MVPNLPTCERTSIQGAEMQHATIVESVKIAPPAIVSVLGFAGMSIEQWVTVLTIIYLFALIAEKFVRLIKILVEKDENEPE
mgnify:CR=1 FL=1